ncbi:MAG: TRAP transporter small permease [Rubricella sp.]
MAIVIWPLKALIAVNSAILAVGRQIAWVLLGIMVLAILYQVFMRYVLNDAPNWTEEFARFCMLWMVGLIAPTGYRWGGFVAIDFVRDTLPRVAGQVLTIALLLLSTFVLIRAVQLGWNHVDGGWLWNSSSLRLPLQYVGGESIRIKLAWMYMALLVGFILLLSINIELIGRQIVRLFAPDQELPADEAMQVVQGAE